MTALDAPPTDTLLASDSLAEHWTRGAIGLVLAVAAFGLIGVVGPVTLLLLLLSRGPGIFSLDHLAKRALDRHM